MSADSPRRAAHKGAQVVSPQPIVDRTIIDSVAGIINDIVPQAYAGTPSSDNKESISWARFEYADINDPASYPDYNESSSMPPLLLVLGYTTGVQVWLITATGEATEVLSWRQGIVRTFRILPNPKTDDEHVDPFETKRPMVAICDSAGPGPQFCSVSFISLKTGEQMKSIKFKNPVCDILANRRSVVVAFLEKIAVFDARTLNDVLTITTCYASPGPNPNPIALGTRWLAYSEKKLLPGKRSSGGCEGEGVQSYTATVLYAAKSLGKGLRGLGETVASSLTGNSVSPMAINNMGNDVTQPGVITILDLQAAKEERESDDANIETIVAHFTAHSDAIVAMTFDLTGALLMTADKRGHDFHVFRIQPHPGGSTLAAVHHLYILHRGDTTAKVQDMTFSSDARWAAVSTVRGTTHVFPVAPYGGPVGVRTHSTPHVVNRLSRFHRSAGLTDDSTRSHSPVSHSEVPLSIYPYANPRLPPYPHPTILHPLAQIRQPSSLSHTGGQSQTSRPQQRQRLHSDDSGTLPLKICACFAPPRAWIYAQRETSSKVTKRAVDSLFIMACHGNMIQYDLEPKPAAGVPKEKVCDDTMIELEIEAKGQWPLIRSPSSLEIVPPLPLSSPLLTATVAPKNASPLESTEDRWLSQVEIVTHAGPHRRLWMGPQFVFKTYNAPSGVAVNLVEAEAVEVGVTGGSRPARSNPVNMPHATSRPLVPVVIDGSGSSYEQSPRFMEAYGDPLDGENLRVGSGENQLREDLAEAMLETSITPNRARGRRSVIERVGQPVAKVVNPLGTVITVSADEEDASSSQEFDSAEENLAPEPPRSVCAEEGPASLGELEPLECQTLRDLTEICAEMRSASEPAIDRVPDDSIREVKERKELCVEMAVAARSSTIDFEREEAFRDVPTSLSLCAEQGEIPSSPMTHAKETAWCKRSKKDELEMHERSLAKAKYVVNYDEDCVVLMEDKTGCDKRGKASKTDLQSVQTQKQSSKISFEQEKSRKVKNTLPINETSKRTTIECRRIDKYILKEQDDSIIIEDTTEMLRPRKSDETIKKVSCNVQIEKRCEESTKKGNSNVQIEKKCEETKKKNISDTRSEKKVVGKIVEDVGRSETFEETRKDCKKSEEKSKEKEELKSDCRSVDSFVELERELEASSVDCEIRNETKESWISESQLAIEDPEPPPLLEDFGSIDYQIVETTCKDASLSNQSDEDIEHIQHVQNNETTQTEADLSRFRDPASCSESSPVAQRKSSKSTISDDDLEYIHSSELTDTLDRTTWGKSVNPERLDDTYERTSTCSRSNKKQSKQAWSSDDDLEHVQYSDICESESGAVCETSEKNLEKATSQKKSQKLLTQQTSKTKSKRRKDIVVIDALEVWDANTPRKDSLEEIDKCAERCTETKDITSQQVSSWRSSRRARLQTTSSILSKRNQRTPAVIIDIDAIRKAEMELKVHELPPGTRWKKSQLNKKLSQPETSSEENVIPVCDSSASYQASKIKIAELQQAAEELLVDSKWQETTTQTTPHVEVSWSTIVKKKNISSVENEPRKELDLEPVLEVEEKLDRDETKGIEIEKEIETDEETAIEIFEESRRNELMSILEEETKIHRSSRNDEDVSTVFLEEIVPVDISLDEADPLVQKDRTIVEARKDETKRKGVGGGNSSKIQGTTSRQVVEDTSDVEKIDSTTSKYASSKENSPEREHETEKRSDSEQEAVPERSSSSDELNTVMLNVATPVDVEEERGTCCDVVERNVVVAPPNGASGGITYNEIYSAAKRNAKWRKKKRR